ncbi:hypothetical protein [[Kitasatospora] papulosa]|uniref:hypothetical protein n=1 Tax=[Kitasatospora] papulosa TaxID=1464011 RepID=UPI0036AE9212
MISAHLPARARATAPNGRPSAANGWTARSAAAVKRAVETVTPCSMARSDARSATCGPSATACPDRAGSAPAAVRA